MNTHLSPGRIGLYAFLLISAAFFLIPLIVIFTTSIKTVEEIRAGSIFLLPQALDFTAWSKAWSGACIGRECNGISPGFFNSVKIMLLSTSISLFLAALNGFALAQWRIPHEGKLLAFLLLGAFLPYQVMLFPLVRMFTIAGINQTLAGIVLVHVLFGLPILILIFRNFYLSLPSELIKAARVDGAGFFQTFFRIILPMSVNVILVAAILSVTGVWNDYLLGLIFAGRENLPMTVALASLVGTQIGVPEHNVNMAATLITAVPPLLLYLASGRYFVRGVTTGAVKG